MPNAWPVVPVTRMVTVFVSSFEDAGVVLARCSVSPPRRESSSWVRSESASRSWGA
jgi:hypothetical protein